MRMDALLSPMNTMKVIKLRNVKCFDSSIYYFVLILRKPRYMFSKE